MGNVTCFKRIDYRLWLYEMSDQQTFSNPQHGENALVERGTGATHCRGIEDWATACEQATDLNIIFLPCPSMSNF